MVAERPAEQEQRGQRQRVAGDHPLQGAERGVELAGRWWAGRCPTTVASIAAMPDPSTVATMIQRPAELETCAPGSSGLTGPIRPGGGPTGKWSAGLRPRHAPELVGRDRMAEEVPLGEIARQDRRGASACRAEVTPSATTCRPRVLRQLGDGVHDGLVVSGAAEARDEGLVDLDGADRELADVAQRRVPGAEVVDGQLDAQLVQFDQTAPGLVLVAGRRVSVTSRTSAGRGGRSPLRPGRRRRTAPGRARPVGDRTG